MKLLAATLVLLGPSVLAILDTSLLKDYLRWQRLRVVIVFHCLDQHSGILELSRRMSYSFSGKIHYVDISNFSTTSWNHTLAMEFTYYQLGATVDIQCSSTNKLFEVISTQRYFNASYHWLLFTNSSLEPATCLLDDQDLNIDAKVTLAVETVDESGYDLYDVYSPYKKRGVRMNVTRVGNWSADAGFWFASNQTEYERRIDFGGIWLMGAVTALNGIGHETLLEHLASGAPVEEYALHRFGYRMWELVMMKHNFSIRPLRTTSWGLSNAHGRRDTGVYDQEAGKEIDLVINGLTYTQDRVASFDNTVAVGLSRMLIIFRHPKVVGSRNVFLRPFDVDLWIAVLGIGILATMVLFGNCSAEGFKEYEDPEMQDNRSLVFLTIFGILCQQGFSTKTLFISTRITLISTLIFSVLINQFYSTFIVGYLLIVPSKTMSTLQHLLDSDVKVIVEDIDYNIHYLNTTKDPLAIQLYRNKILATSPENSFVHVSDGVARVKQGGYAFQCDTSYAYPLVRKTFTDKEMCDLQETLLNPMLPLHLPLPKGSPFKEMFRVTLRKTVESSVAGYQQRVYFAEKPECPKSELDTIYVDLESVSSLFYGMLYCLVACLGILVGEFVTFYYLRGPDERYSNLK